jgi:hypothetical protein
MYACERDRTRERERENDKLKATLP